MLVYGDEKLSANLKKGDDIDNVFKDFFCMTDYYDGTLLVVVEGKINALYGFSSLKHVLSRVSEDGVKRMIRGCEKYLTPYDIKIVDMN